MTKAKELPSIEYLNEVFQLDVENGNLIWKVRPLHHFKNEKIYYKWNKFYPDKIAGSLVRGCNTNKNIFYRRVKINDIAYKIHRIVFKMFYGYEAELIDHINGDHLDNRPSNLRSVSHKENARNRSISSRNTSGIVGVMQVGDKFKAFVHDGDNCIQKLFDDRDEAAKHAIIIRAKAGFHPNHGRQKNYLKKTT